MDEDDQCGAIGDARDPRTPVCCLKPGHKGPHRERVLIERTIGNQPLLAELTMWGLRNRVDAGIEAARLSMDPLVLVQYRDIAAVLERANKIEAACIEQLVDGTRCRLCQRGALTHGLPLEHTADCPLLPADRG